MMGLGVAGAVLMHCQEAVITIMTGKEMGVLKGALPLLFGFSKEGSPEKEKPECLFKMQISVPHPMALN